MPDWTAFGAVAGFVLFFVLALASLTTATLSGDGSERSTRAPREPPERSDSRDVGGDRALDADRGAAVGPERAPARPRPDPQPTADEPTERANGVGAAGATDAEPSVGSGTGAHDDGPELPSMSSTMLLGNVIVTHGVLSVVIVGAAAMTGVPDAALGVADAAWSTGPPAVLGGLALGLALAVANAVGAANLERFGIEHSEALRSSLAPESRAGWALLLGVTLPLVAIFEELLFRGVLVGAAAVATGLSAWWFVVPASVAFAAGHGLQGRGGILVTGTLGAVLAVAFVLTNSLLLVVVAHYVVNAVEFLVHEWLGVDLHARLAV